MAPRSSASLHTWNFEAWLQSTATYLPPDSVDNQWSRLTRFQWRKQGFTPEAPFHWRAIFKPSPSPKRNTSFAKMVTGCPLMEAGLPAVCKPLGPPSVKRSKSRNMRLQPPTTNFIRLVRTTAVVSHKLSLTTGFSSRKVKLTTIVFRSLCGLSTLPGVNSSKTTTKLQGASAEQGCRCRAWKKTSSIWEDSRMASEVKRLGSATSQSKLPPSSRGSSITRLTSSR